MSHDSFLRSWVANKFNHEGVYKSDDLIQLDPATVLPQSSVIHCMDLLYGHGCHVSMSSIVEKQNTTVEHSLQLEMPQPIDT